MTISDEKKKNERELKKMEYVGGGAVVTNDWCTSPNTIRFPCFHELIDETWGSIIVPCLFRTHCDDLYFVSLLLFHPARVGIVQ